MEEQEIDNFKAVIKTTGQSLMIIIPYNIRDFGGYTAGDNVKILIKKIPKLEENV